MKIFKFIIAIALTNILLNCGMDANAQTQKKDTISNDSYDNFKNKPNLSPSFVVIKSKTGNVLFEHNLDNGKCVECYDKLTLKADSCYQKKNFSDAATLYTTAFTLNNNMGKVKHRLTAACCQVGLNDIDGAFENLNKVVFGAKFKNLKEITSNDCYKPLHKDPRWTKLIEGLNKNLEETPQKMKAETPVGL